MHVQERRSATRHLSSSEGYVILNGIDLDLKAHDISSGGALVELPSRCSIREGLKLSVHLDIGYVGTAVVCRASANHALFALKFEYVLPETLTRHCAGNMPGKEACTAV